MVRKACNAQLESGLSHILTTYLLNTQASQLGVCIRSYSPLLPLARRTRYQSYEV